MPHWWLRDIDVFDQFLQIWKIPGDITWRPADQNHHFFLAPRQHLEPRWKKKNASLSLRNMSRWNAKGILPEYAAWICFFCFKTISYKFSAKTIWPPRIRSHSEFPGVSMLPPPAWRRVVNMGWKKNRQTLRGFLCLAHLWQIIPKVRFLIFCQTLRESVLFFCRKKIPFPTKRTTSK